MSRIRLIVVAVMVLAINSPVQAHFHLWQVTELYSNADGSIQFIELTALAGGQEFLSGHSIQSVQGSSTNTYTFPADLPGDTTGKTFLIGTAGFAALNLVTPDYVVPNGFLFTTDGVLQFADGADTWTYGTLPTSGGLSLMRAGGSAVNTPRNFAGATGTVTVSLTGADSVSPNSGAGASQTFALQYSDTAGMTDLATMWVWFNATFAPTAANSCLAYYQASTQLVLLLNDAGTAWTSGLRGSVGTLQNSQCTIQLASTTLMGMGNALTLNLAVIFNAAFAGAKNIYMFASGNSGENSGWQTRGTWTVTGGVVVTADSVTPASGTGVAQTFALQYSDTAGLSDLATMWVWFNSTLAPTAANSCLAYYQTSTQLVLLLNDAGTGWTSGLRGTAGTLQNSQCTIQLAATTLMGTGNTLTLNLAVIFNAAFAGAKNIHMYANGNSGAGSGWQTRGTWTVSGGVMVTADSVTPASGSGAAQTFALQYSDTAGITDLEALWVWFTFAPTYASCLAYYDTSTQLVWLLDDWGYDWTSGLRGSVGTLQNSACTIQLAATTLMGTGNTLTLNLAVIFNPAFAGAKNIYMNATGSGAISGWQTRGTWTVSGVVGVTADSVAPASGSGGAQIFALQYSDVGGLNDLATAWVWFNPTFASTATNSCLAYYQTSTQTLFLLNDAGTAWMSSPFPTLGTLENSACTIQLATSSLVGTSNTLTVNLAVIFNGAFAGTKNIYMYATGSSGGVSGWQTRGTWTVLSDVAVTADSVMPAMGSGASQTFALQYSDEAGFSDLATMWVWFNATFASTAANSCLAYYQPGTQTVSLLNDAGTAWLSGTIANGGTLQNSACAINLRNISAGASGNWMMLNLTVTFSPGYSGGKMIYMYTSGNSGGNSGWQTRGNWTVPG